MGSFLNPMNWRRSSRLAADSLLIVTLRARQTGMSADGVVNPDNAPVEKQKDTGERVSPECEALGNGWQSQVLLLLDMLFDVVANVLRDGRGEIAHHHHGVAGVPIHTQVAVHAWRSAAVSDHALALHETLFETVGVLFVRADFRLSGEYEIGEFRVYQFMCA